MRIRKILLFIFGIFPSILYAEPRLTVVLDWYINPTHAPLLVAEQQGFFKEQGLRIQWIEPGDPTDGPKLVAARKADIALTYQPQLLIQVDQGLPLMRFGSLIDTPLDCVVTLKSQHIRTMADFKGKTIGYSSGGIDHAMLGTMLRKQGLTLADVTLINVRYGLVQALLSGNINAFTGGMRNVEPIELDQSGHPAAVFYPEENGFPTYEELIFVAHQDQIHNPQFIGFLKALQHGTAYLRAHPQTCWESAIKQYPALNNPLNKASWFASLRYFSQNPAALDNHKYEVFAQFMQQQGLIKTWPRLNRYTLDPRADHWSR